MVAVVAPDGSKEYWIAALEYKDAVAAVKKREVAASAPRASRDGEVARRQETGTVRGLK
jgi:hypothetical protein